MLTRLMPAQHKTSVQPELATDFEVWRYYDMHARIKNSKYIEVLPTVTWHNGAPKNEVQVIIDSYATWDEASKIKTRMQVKKDLPILERKFKEIREKFYKGKNISRSNVEMTG
jgi:hypothetical protein